MEEAKVKDENREIAKFLEEWGLDDESFKLLTETRLETFLAKYQKNNPNFKLRDRDIAAISEAAQSKTEGILLSNFSSTKILSF